MAVRFGTQPARQIIIDRGLSNRQVAHDIGVDEVHFQGVMQGRVVPKQELREKLPAYLDVRLEDCFTADLLARQYGGVRGRRGGVRREEAAL